MQGPTEEKHVNHLIKEETRYGSFKISPPLQLTLRLKKEDSEATP